MKEIELEKLPYAEDALAPVISANTISFHYGKHHAGYVKTLNGLIAGTKYAELPLVEIVRASSSDGNVALFNSSPYDMLMRVVAASSSSEARDAYLTDAELLLLDQGYAIPLWHDVRFYRLRTGFAGLLSDGLGVFRFDGVRPVSN